MGYPEGYPDDLKNSIFAHTPDPGIGSLTFVMTRSGGGLRVYVLQHLGHVRSASSGGRGGDVYLAADSGSIADAYYNPHDEESFIPGDMAWDGERPRLSQPVRRWLESRDMLVASRDVLLDMVASEKNIDLHAPWRAR